MIKSAIGLSLVICLSVPVLSQGSEKEMYRWTDENGVVHFTDERPPGQNVEVIPIPSSDEKGIGVSNTPAPSGDGEAAEVAAEVAAEDEAMEEALSPGEERRREMAQRREKILEARAENEKECAAKRAEVEQLEPARRVYFTNEQGEVERMDDQERVDKVAEAKSYIAANCN